MIKIIILIIILKKIERDYCWKNRGREKERKMVDFRVQELTTTITTTLTLDWIEMELIIISMRFDSIQFDLDLDFFLNETLFINLFIYFAA